MLTQFRVRAVMTTSIPVHASTVFSHNQLKYYSKIPFVCQYVFEEYEQNKKAALSTDLKIF